MSSRLLPRSFFARDAESVARDLLGRLIVSTVGGARTAGRIVEVEAYLGPHDPASHAAAWHRSPRNEVMYGPPGFLYVYFTYGMHWCANVVAGPKGFPSAVLLRAIEPLAGLGVMRRRRGGVADRLLASGPARLTQALGITRRQNGCDLRRGPVRLLAGTPLPASKHQTAPRIGIREAVSWKLRFFEKGSGWVSR